MAIVIIPAYQPDHELEKIVEQLWQCGNMAVVVDDGSGKEYQHIFESVQDICVILHHDRNRGKGAAIKTALNYIHKEVWDQELIGIMDADGQHLVEDMQRLLNNAAKCPDALIIGVRRFDRSVPFRSRLGNAFATGLFYLVTGKWLSDTQTGLRAFHEKQMETYCSLSGERYEYEMNMLIDSCRRKIPVREIRIHTIYHDKKNSCSHFKPFRDAWRVLKAELFYSSERTKGAAYHGKKAIMVHN